MARDGNVREMWSVLSRDVEGGSVMSATLSK